MLVGDGRGVRVIGGEADDRLAVFARADVGGAETPNFGLHGQALSPEHRHADDVGVEVIAEQQEDDDAEHDDDDVIGPAGGRAW